MIIVKIKGITRACAQASASPVLSRLLALALALSMLAAPSPALASNGGKNYKRGLEHEAAQQWEKAAEEFALAVAADPSNAEYQLHYRRSVFNASQMFMQKGAALMERSDYVGAYNAFRRAYGYDPVNELARSMMDRAFRKQLGEGDADKTPPRNNGAPVEQLSPAAYARTSANLAPSHQDAVSDDPALSSPGNEQLRVITFSGDLENFIKYLARQIRLNVVFDRDFPRRTVAVDLHEVTAAQALDYVFLTQGLFFQKLSNRTILVADQVKRPQYQQLMLRTFYLYNVDPNEARQLIQASIPPQAGRQPVITVNKSTNSITVRDTPENIRLVGEILRGLDKERAEVVMDVRIYEVSRSDLMQLGNQIGSESSLSNLGGIQKGLSVLGGSREVVSQALSAIPTALGAAFLIPPTALSAIQRKDTTRLVASTQVHAFDGEKSTAHIGQRVPVQTASVTPFGSVSNGDNNQQQGVTPGLFGGNGFPVIQYEKTGLTLEFTPQVFPNLDVQVKMSIKSNEVVSTGGAALTPTFTERNIEGTARIQNSRTMMIASVAQNQQTRGRQGLPVLGLVPVLGRFFTAPRHNDQQTDIVIAVTPHVLRAPSLTPRDEEMHPSGTLQTPTSETLEAMLRETVRDEQLAAARALSRHRVVELPEEETASFIPAPKELMNASAAPSSAVSQTEVYDLRVNAAREQSSANISRTVSHTTTANAPPTRAARDEEPAGLPVAYAPANTETAATVSSNSARANDRAAALNPTGNIYSMMGAEVPRSAAALRLMAEAQTMRAGEKRRFKLLLKTDAPLGMLAATIRFDPRVVSVRAVERGPLAPTTSATLNHTLTPNGSFLVTIAPTTGAPAITGAGVLFVLEVEALSSGASPLALATEDVQLVAVDGRRIQMRVMSDEFSVSR